MVDLPDFSEFAEFEGVGRISAVGLGIAFGAQGIGR